MPADGVYDYRPAVGADGDTRREFSRPLVATSQVGRRSPSCAYAVELTSEAAETRATTMADGEYSF